LLLYIERGENGRGKKAFGGCAVCKTNAEVKHEIPGLNAGIVIMEEERAGG